MARKRPRRSGKVGRRSTMKNHSINVQLGHVCDPPVTPVKAGDTVVWDGAVPIEVTFPSGTLLFRQGSGPFRNGQAVTVNSKPPLKKNDKFTPDIKLNGDVRVTRGDIKVT